MLNNWHKLDKGFTLFSCLDPQSIGTLRTLKLLYCIIKSSDSSMDNVHLYSPCSFEASNICILCIPDTFEVVKNICIQFPDHYMLTNSFVTSVHVVLDACYF